MNIYPVKENFIGSAVSEIFRYRQTNILALYYKNIKQSYLTYLFLLQLFSIKMFCCINWTLKKIEGFV